MNVIVEDIGRVIARMRIVSDGPPYYMYGHRLEIARELLMKDAKDGNMSSKYPLFILAMDIPEEKKGKMVHCVLNMAIVYYTKTEYLTQQRYNNVIKPVLYPLYDKFFKELRKSGLFVWPNIGQEPEHTKVDRPYWGTAFKDAMGDRIDQVFKDPLDAVEITNLKINQYIKC